MVRPQAEFSSAGAGYQLPTYAFERPPELNGEVVQAYPVVVVGAGLGGLTLGVDLLQRGVPVVLVDEDNTVGVRGAASRGICYAQKSLEIFARLGIYDRIAAKGVQWQVGRTMDGSDEVYCFDLRDSASASVSVQPPFINIQQYYIELFLVERFLALAPSVAGSSLRWQTRVAACSQADGAASLALTTPQGDYTVRTQWVVDASGVHSAIRTGFDLPVNGIKGEDRWCISDVRFKTEPAAERLTWIQAPFNDNRAVWQHLMADGVWRLDYQMAANTDMVQASRAEVVTERLQKQFGPDVAFELIWVGPYGYRSQMLNDFQHGRVLFVGDAAHVMSPFGARGGNSAIQDADNLAWKLAAVLQGAAAPALIKTYSSERVPAAQENIEVTRRTMRFLAAKPGIETTLRRAVLALARQYPFARKHVNTGRMSVASTYPSPFPQGGLSVQNVALFQQGQVTTVVALSLNLNAGVLLCAWGAAQALLPICLAQLPASLRAVGVSVMAAQESLGEYRAHKGDGAMVQDTHNDLAVQCGVDPRLGGLAIIRPDMYCFGSASPAQALNLVQGWIDVLQGDNKCP